MEPLGDIWDIGSLIMLAWYWFTFFRDDAGRVLHTLAMLRLGTQNPGREAGQVWVHAPCTRYGFHAASISRDNRDFSAKEPLQQRITCTTRLASPTIRPFLHRGTGHIL